MVNNACSEANGDLNYSELMPHHMGAVQLKLFLVSKKTMKFTHQWMCNIVSRACFHAHIHVPSCTQYTRTLK